MTSIGTRHLRAVLGLAFSARLLASAATPAVAQHSARGSAECTALIGTDASGARGCVDSRGVVREPVVAKVM